MSIPAMLPERPFPHSQFSMIKDYERMSAKGKELCNSDDLVRLGSKGNMTLNDMMARF